jgi:general secretion pathway protein G
VRRVRIIALYRSIKSAPMDARKSSWLDARWSASRSPAGGFTLPEMLVAIAICVIFLAIAVPSYKSYADRVKVTKAIVEIGAMAGSIQRYSTLYNSVPPDLAAIGWDTVLDPWGNPYQYLSFQGLKGKGKMRKDKSLVPINTEYDLYSMGADGQSVPPLTAKSSQDDVILANDGSYIGLASDY